MNLKIFKPYEDFSMQGKFDIDEDNMFSLNQILANHLSERSHTQEAVSETTAL